MGKIAILRASWFVFFASHDYYPIRVIKYRAIEWGRHVAHMVILDLHAQF
jgi:hypothetical protein